MKDKYYRIGEVSRITGISKDTLHFYTKIGLLVPDYTDPENQYRYYSRENLWQLDIITTCRKLGIPLEKVKEILSLRDNGKIVDLLMDYREEALRLSLYYQQVANDILWYNHENERIEEERQTKGESFRVRVKYLEQERVIAGRDGSNPYSYHAFLQEAVRDTMKHTGTIQKRYGYDLDLEQMVDNRFVKQREYLRLSNIDWEKVKPENVLVIPAGEYAIFTLHISEEKADFGPFRKWLEQNHYTADRIFAEEIGLQLFDYLPDYYCEVHALLKRY